MRLTQNNLQARRNMKIHAFGEHNNITLSNNCIEVRGAREHNLKDVDVSIPRNALVVFSGVSGSGKSSLAFGTIFACQRQFKTDPFYLKNSKVKLTPLMIY